MEHDMWRSILAKGGRVSGKKVDQRCPDFKF